MGGACCPGEEVPGIFKRMGALALCRNRQATFASLESLGDARGSRFWVHRLKSHHPICQDLNIFSRGLDLVIADLPVLGANLWSLTTPIAEPSGLQPPRGPGAFPTQPSLSPNHQLSFATAIPSPPLHGGWCPLFLGSPGHPTQHTPPCPAEDQPGRPW